MRAYEYKHVVSFEETNLVGNVYYANHIRWQGRCREMFLKAHAPDTLTALKQDLSLVTTRVSCEYYLELEAFDEIVLRMTVGGMTDSRVTMLFDYFRIDASERRELVAMGEQQIACLRRQNGTYAPGPMPAPLAAALLEYAE